MDQRPAARTWPRTLSLCTAAAVAVLLASCASESADDSVTPQDAPASSAPATELTIEVTDGATTSWTLTCEPNGGDHPDINAACAALTENGAQAMPATPADSMCTQQFGGEQTAVVTGTWRGEAVDASFSRTDGCELSRWDALAPLLPKITA